MNWAWCSPNVSRPKILELSSPSRSARSPALVDASIVLPGPTKALRLFDRCSAPRPSRSAASSPFDKIYVEEGRRPGQLSFHIEEQGTAYVSLRDTDMHEDFGRFMQETGLKRERYPLTNVVFSIEDDVYRLSANINWGQAVHGVQEWLLKLEFDITCSEAEVSIFRNDGYLPTQPVCSFNVQHWRTFAGGSIGRIYVPLGHQPGQFSFHHDSCNRAFISLEAKPGKDDLLDSFLEHTHLERRRYALSEVNFDPELQTLTGCVHWGIEVDGREEWGLWFGLSEGGEHAELRMFKGNNLDDSVDLQLWHGDEDNIVEEVLLGNVFNERAYPNEFVKV